MNTIEMTNETGMNMPKNIDQVIADGGVDSPEQPKKKGAKKQATPKPASTERVGKIFFNKIKGKLAFYRATQEPVGTKEATEEVLSGFGAKEINGFTADLLGVEKVGGDKDGKKVAIARFFKAAYEKLPLSQPAAGDTDTKKKKASDKPKADKPAKAFVVSFNPADEAQALAFEQLAPQGKACVLAALGISKPPKDAREAKITSKELEAVLEARREIFGTQQPLKRIWGYHRPMLVAGGFLAVEGGKGGTRATDKYVYAFRFNGSEKNVAKYEELPPQAQDCLKIGLGVKNIGGETKNERELSGADWRNKLLKAKADGRLKTKQNPFRIFQYHEHLLVDAGFLNVRS